ncbi:hypothetical protein ACRQ5B_06830 [Pseudarthrobacter sp. L19]|uniref:hypothetical protein n=1 Tax=Pseudarthrobacter sp. L19 TaxID=3423951 RepID=UPI003D791EF3
MQFDASLFDLTTVETGTLVFGGTLLFAALLALFIMTAATVALALLGVGKLAWFLVVRTLVGVVSGINTAWEHLVHHAGQVELPGDFPGELIGHSSPSTGTYPRVVLRDS